MTLTLTYYNVTIARSAPNNLEPATPTEKRGFIDNKNPERYRTFDSNNLPVPASLPSTFVLSKEKDRGYIRYLKMIEQLNETQSIFDLVDVTAVAATPDASATSMTFFVGYSRPDYIYTYNELFGFVGHPTEFDKILYNEDAVKRQIARTFVRDEYNISIQGYNPDIYDNNPFLDLNILSPAVGATLAAKIDYVEANITVTQYLP